VIPTYNEAKNINKLIPMILKIFKKGAIQGKVLIVDDASPDGTGKLAEDFAKISGSVQVLQRPRKMGLGSAYKDGFKVVILEEEDGAIEMDADLSHDPGDIPSFIEKLREGYDLVIGSRYIPGGRIPKWPIYRRIISSLTNRTTSRILRLKQNDVTSGYRAYSLKALKTIDFTAVNSDGYAFQVEMVMRCQRAGLKICEIPIAFKDREEGKSKLSRKEMWRFMKSMIRLMMI